MGNCLSKIGMANYILDEQVACGWRFPLKPVLKCCINMKSRLGFCNVCKENFAHRNGSYYPGFRYRSDDELLNRVASGKKPLASIVRKEEDRELEETIESLGLHLVRKFRNQWGMLEYIVMKDIDMKLSDVADLDSISELLGVVIPDMRLRDISDEPCKVFQGLMFGYPFYTLTVDDYLS
jgi:hypothetical protein